MNDLLKSALLATTISELTEEVKRNGFVFLSEITDITTHGVICDDYEPISSDDNETCYRVVNGWSFDPEPHVLDYFDEYFPELDFMVVSDNNRMYLKICEKGKGGSEYPWVVIDEEFGCYSTLNVAIDLEKYEEGDNVQRNTNVSRELYVLTLEICEDGSMEEPIVELYDNEEKAMERASYFGEKAFEIINMSSSEENPIAVDDFSNEAGNEPFHGLYYLDGEGCDEHARVRLKKIGIGDKWVSVSEKVKI